MKRARRFIGVRAWTWRCLNLLPSTVIQNMTKSCKTAHRLTTTYPDKFIAAASECMPPFTSRNHPTPSES